ncbi:MAG: hypothetical protein OXI96_03510 [Acidimicrobiaceae bacterium]|nr:hypothetical protein [Acidimicrobiaceae bacterium]
MVRWENPGPWYGRFRDRLRFEVPARTKIPGLRSRRRPQGRGWQYLLSVKPPGCPTIKVRIDYLLPNPHVPHVIVNGPTDSPHRYHDGTLCMWYPQDPVDRRWTFSDGLLHLIGLIQVHLIREHLWRETGK